MRAMVLAAGLGTRLRPLTNDRPKALVEVAGHTLLEITLARLRSFGVIEVIVNVHHFADQIVAYLNQHDNFGMRIAISREDDELLETGGGLKKAAWFFLENSGENNDEPFLLHNVDVISNIDLRRMIEFHQQHQALATLAVQGRETSRYLLFDDAMQLCGRSAGSGENAATEWARHSTQVQGLAFSGIHVISPPLLGMMNEQGAFSIISTYLRLAGRGEKITGFRADGAYWRDLGKPENVVQAAEDFKQGVVSV
jgi:NDP-sugar pyrophosphorylase family protein